jgi:hypothetical protein
MSRMIGFDRKLQLGWMDATAGLCRDGLAPDAIAEKLDRRLAEEVQGVEARRKTITVLKRIWVTVPETSEPFRGQALRFVAHVNSRERLWVHWGMSLLAYPFFRDVAATVGQLGRLQGQLSQAQVQRRMVEGWGERTTLVRAIQRLLRTLVEWDVLGDADERGSYAFPPARQTENQDLALWLLDCALTSGETDQVPLAELGQLAYLFPFDLLSFLPEVRRSEKFRVSRQGLDLEMVASSEER